MTPYKNVGMITGSARAALGTNLARVAAVRNCKVGGNLVFAENKETIDDSDGGLPVETITNVLTPLDETSCIDCCALPKTALVLPTKSACLK